MLMVRRVSQQAEISPPTSCAQCELSVTMSNVSSCIRRHLSEAVDIGWRSILLSRGRMSVNFVIFGDKNPRADVTASQPNPTPNHSEVSLGHSGSSVDRAPKKDIVSEDTSPSNVLQMNSATTRAVYLLNRSHSFGVGVLIMR